MEQNQNKTAASPSYLGEYNYDQFKRMARPGQIWQTSHSMLRIDKLLGNVLTRRMSRFMKFYGAYTGTSPRALRSLMPQKDGRFLSSSGPWSVSRKYEPFLLLKTGIFEGMPEFAPGAPEIQNPPIDEGLVPGLAPEPNLAQGTPSNSIIDDSVYNLPPIQADLANQVSESETLLALIDKCRGAYTEFDATYREQPGHDKEENLAFDIKVGLLNIPDAIRESISESELSAIYDSYSEFYIREYLDFLPAIFKWVQGPYITGRSGRWLEVPVDISALLDHMTSEYTPGESADEFIDSVAFYATGENVVDVDPSNWNDLSPETQGELIKRLQDLIPALSRATRRLRSLYRDVKQSYNHFIHELESPEFWQREIQERGIEQQANLKPILQFEDV